MKTAEQRQSEAQVRTTEAVVARHVRELFERLPMLAGFWVRPDLEIVELSIFSWPGYTAGPEVYEEVVQSLGDIAGERPEAVQLMRGRTFAREVH